MNFLNHNLCMSMEIFNLIFMKVDLSSICILMVLFSCIDVSILLSSIYYWNALCYCWKSSLYRMLLILWLLSQRNNVWRIIRCIPFIVIRNVCCGSSRIKGQEKIYMNPDIEFVLGFWWYMLFYLAVTCCGYSWR